MQCSRRTAVLCLFVTTVVIMYLYITSITNYHESYKKPKRKKVKFNQDENDVFSFVHIQKTGGTTFEKYLVFNIENSNCQCASTKKKPSCMCYRKNSQEIWSVNRYIQPKWPCGLHPDLMTLRECTPNFMNTQYGEKYRKYFYGTILRDPVLRYLSEFRHMQRGASWALAASLCRGKPLLEQLNPCFEGSMWHNLTLQIFMSCSTNLARNRQTWMLSNISRLGCDFNNIMDDKKRSEHLLSIAKINLKKMAYFGLLEYPDESQFIFEKTFGLRFIEPFKKHNTGFANEYLNSFEKESGKNVVDLVKDVNGLDIDLYDTAKSLFFKRYKRLVKTYGKPMYKPSSKEKLGIEKTNLNKLERLKKNLPKSAVKEALMKKRREDDLERIRQKRLVKSSQNSEH